MEHHATGLSLKFWGVRGSAPTPALENLGFGGNTSCIEVRSGNDVLVFDLGTGARKLGETLLAAANGGPLRIHVFLTHYHWDHLQGMPLFMPLYRPHSEITFHASVKLGSIRERLRGQMTAPYFPVDFDHLPAKIQFIEIDDNVIQIGDVGVRCFPMHHPQGAAGFHIETPDALIVHASDMEHGNPEMDHTIREFARGADILIYDAQYTPAEYPDHLGWGHSCWTKGAEVARDAGVKKLILFHHDPSHDDTFMEQLESEAQQVFPNTVAAREGMVVRVPDLGD